MKKIDIIDFISSKNPGLKNLLRKAEINKTTNQFISESITMAAIATLMIGFLLFMFLQQMELLSLLLPAILLTFYLMYKAIMGTPLSKIKALQKDIDREILFAGRFVLIKIHSGRPLLNALIEATKSYGVSSKYFRKIVSEIETGTSIEQAIEKEMNSTPSEKFQKILFQINNALKLGIDVTEPLSMILDEISNDQKIEIMKYGKKLNSVVMFYMLAAIVVPSLGITMLVVVLGLVSIPIDATVFIAGIGALVMVQFAFLSVFKSIRPTVNI